MPAMPRPSTQAEEIFEDIMGEPHNVTRNIPVKGHMSKKRVKNNPNGDLYNQPDNRQRSIYEK